MKRLWALRRRVSALLLKAVMFVAGVLILRHEIFQAKSVDPLLVFVGLYFLGVPPAMFFDGLRKFNDFVSMAEKGPGGSAEGPHREGPAGKKGGPWQV